jgi:hypothetical protein
MLNEAHTGERRGTMPLRVLIARMRHEGCGGGAGRMEPADRRRRRTRRPFFCVPRTTVRPWGPAWMPLTARNLRRDTDRFRIPE